VAGATWLFTLKDLLLSDPNFDYSGKRLILSFSGARAHETTIGAKDAFSVIFSNEAVRTTAVAFYLDMTGIVVMTPSVAARIRGPQPIVCTDGG
jgi:hypothetical protein